MKAALLSKNNILILLFEIGFGLKFNLGGEISLSEIFLIFFVLFNINKLQLFYRNKDFKIITNLYLLLLISQVISEIVVGNDTLNSVKMFALTIMSYFHFFFLFSYFIRNRKLILFALAGFVIRSLVFKSDFEADSIDSILSGEAAAFVKFYLSQIIVYSLLIFSVFYKNKKNMSFIVMFFGFLLVVLGARSAGAIFMLSGVLYFLILTRKKINFRQVLTNITLVLIFGYSLYFVYVNQVLSGTITSGNAYQITRLENPYNPFNLFVYGRTEVFVGIEAFLDKFWFGHGAWARDTTLKYYSMMFDLRDDVYKEYSKDYFLIPSHSVIIGAGVSNGVFSLFFMSLILFQFIRRGFNSLTNKNIYLLILIYISIELIWHSLFSPLAHFRITFPLIFAFILSSYLVNNRTRKFSK